MELIKTTQLITQTSIYYLNCTNTFNSSTFLFSHVTQMQHTPSQGAILAPQLPILMQFLCLVKSRSSVIQFLKENELIYLKCEKEIVVYSSIIPLKSEMSAFMGGWTLLAVSVFSTGLQEFQEPKQVYRKLH